MKKFDQFDVFLSHNSTDKSIVEEIASSLESVMINPYLDKWHLIPGEPWQEALEDAICQSKTCGVCISSSGIGPWHNEEMRVFLEKRVRDNAKRVIPILLPGTSEETVQSLPSFLSRMHYVDFRPGVASVNGFRSLISGITGVSPKQVKLPFLDTQPKTYNKICVIISGPSSVGKDVVLGRLLELARQQGFFPELLRKYTTRPQRVSESEGEPFIHLNEDEFKEKVSKKLVGCVRFSYGNYYGVDQTFLDGLKYRDLLFVSQRLYEEVDIFKHSASNKGFTVFSILLLADIDTLKARILQRSLESDQKNKRTTQVIEDINYLSKDIGELRDKFDVVVENSDNVSLNETIAKVWGHLEKELNKSKTLSKRSG
ncbi:MAG: TIR domain-containing protein [Rhodospirillales bacterium]|nr:TIR domain-containing protein [Rhodospirillales bacterium]